jgi:LysM repeat protein
MKKVLVMLCVATMLLLTVGGVAAKPALAGDVTHVVQPGQTLLSIAWLYGVDVSTLARANNILNPNYIYVGQRLIIPAKPTAQPATGAYVVKLGDTLYSIARHFGTTAWAIAQANGMYNLNHIYVGQRLMIPGVAPVTPAPQPSGGNWHGEYFNVPDLTGAPAFVRNDSAVNFRWGLRSPDTRLNTDHFSVRWTRTINFRGGVYRFKVKVDDGVRLWVDGALVLDQWRVQPETMYQVDLVLPASNHPVVIEYFDDAATATVQFSFTRLGNAPVTPTATPDASVPADAWMGEYFGNTDLSGKPAVTQKDGSIGFNWGLGAPLSGLPEDYFGVRWTRKDTFFEDNYAFCATADDGVRVYVDGVRVIDEWHAANALSYCAQVDLTKGVHTVKVEYYEDGGNALIYVWWERR